VAAARRAAVVALASPSAVKAWLEVIAGSGDPSSSSETSTSSSSASSDAVCGGVAAACIGSTTADAARKAGFERVFAPEEPGLAGFVEAVVEALEEMKKEFEGAGSSQ
jgi:uroporphyrinogen-III synthase